MTSGALKIICNFHQFLAKVSFVPDLNLALEKILDISNSIILLCNMSSPHHQHTAHGSDHRAPTQTSDPLSESTLFKYHSNCR